MGILIKSENRKKKMITPLVSPSHKQYQKTLFKGNRNTNFTSHLREWL